MRPVTKRSAAFLLTCGALGLGLLVGVVGAAHPQAGTAEEPYSAIEAMIPMRDGVKLHTKILAPSGTHGALPILLQRTPYGIEESEKQLDGSLASLAEDGYVFVFQDLRGKFGSKGVFVMDGSRRSAHGPQRLLPRRIGNG